VRRVPIRMKLAGALVVPLLALVIVTVLEVVQSSRDVEQVREQTALAESSIGPASLLSRLEDERNAAGVWLLGPVAGDQINLPIEDNGEARDGTDAALEEFRAEIETQGGEVEEAYTPAIERMSELQSLRDGVDATPDDQRTLFNIDAVAETFDGYTAVMDAFFDANKRAALAIDDPDLRRGAELVDLSSRQTDVIARLVKDLLLAAVGGESPDGLNSSTEIANTADLMGQLRNNEQLIAIKATGRYRELAEALFAAEEIQRFPQVVNEAIDTGAPDLDGVLTYSAGEDPETFGYTVFRRDVTSTLSAKANELEDAAVARQRWFVVLALIAVGLAFVVTWLVSRSITKPLRSLTRQAKDMAERRLPAVVLDILDTPLGENVAVPRVEPVRVTTRDEVADVAGALNTVQDTALDLAVEQAVLRRNIADSFVNLGRRNQNLLGRQLDFITELETNETDPDALANLFRLDHLATRMRRNAESLLVLAGIEPPRKWAAPVRLTDVIRAALGEVEDYQRVTVRGVEAATILGSAAADLAHLLAELIENALVFSPPDQTVDIRGRNRPDGAYTLAVIDSGLGMPTNDVAAANRRLAGAESFTIAPSKYLGHYVAGNLAARHNIHVHLDNSPGNGITATITVPEDVLTTDPVTSAPVTPPGGMRALAALPPGPRTSGSLPAIAAGQAVHPYPVAPAPAPRRPRRGPFDGFQPPVPMPTNDANPVVPPDPRSAPPPSPTPPEPQGWAPPPWAAPPPSHVDPAPPTVGRPGTSPGVGPAGPGVPASPSPAPDVTSGGLVRRRRVPMQRRVPTVIDDATLLATLGRYGPTPADATAHGSTSPIDASPPYPPPALTRRVKGAQLPDASIMPLRGGPPLPRQPRPNMQSSRANDVQALLAGFTAGVQRGLDEARRRLQP
jgi:signal transduction histidine kinase